MFEFSEWAGLALESGRFIEAGYGNDGKWGCSMVHSRSANSGEEMENLSATTTAKLGRLHAEENYCLAGRGLQLILSASPRFLGGVNSRGWLSIKSTNARHSVGFRMS